MLITSAYFVYRFYNLKLSDSIRSMYLSLITLKLNPTNMGFPREITMS